MKSSEKSDLIAYRLIRATETLLEIDKNLSLIEDLGQEDL